MSASLPAIPTEDVVMNLVQISDWRQFIEDGEKYLSTAIHAAEKRREVFTPEILYNLTAMAIEKYLMGFLMYHGDMADNHTMRDMIESVQRHVKMQPDLAESLLYLDSFQEICDIDTYNRRAPGIEEIPGILAIGQNVRGFVAGIRNA